MPHTDWVSDTRASYDTVAETYADMFRDQLDGQPVIRHLLAMYAELVRDAGAGPVVDVGCGTGRVTAHLRGLGVDAFGVDLSPGMVAMARRDHPGIRFDVGSMTALDLADTSMAGVLAWFSVIHVPDDAVRTAFGEFRRVLRPGGVLLLGFYVGDHIRVKTQGYGGHPMKVNVHWRPLERVAGWLDDAGLRTELRVQHDLGDDGVSGGILIARG